MKKYNRKLVLGFTILFIVLSSMTALANGLIFTDIDGHWSKEFVEDVYSRNITKGYGDATFRPDNSITNLEVIVMVANMLGYDENENAYLEKYKSKLNSLQIPVWAQGYAAYLVESKVVTEKELETLVVKSQAATAKRYEVANYIGRVLVNYAQQSLDRIAVVPYKDALSIPSESVSYISLLLRNNILNPDSNNGRFLPNNQISRAEVAKLIAITAGILDDVKEIDIIEEDIVDEDHKDDIEEEIPVEPGKEVEDTPSEEPIEETKEPVKVEPVILEKQVTISNIFREDKTIIILKDEKGQENIYDVKAEAMITVDGKQSDISKISKGQNAKVKIVDGEVEVITAITRKEGFSGHFVRFLVGTNTVLTLNDQNGNQKVFVVPSSAKIYLDDIEASLSSFKVGDVIKIYYNGDEISSIEGKNKTEYVRGSITNKGTSSQSFIEVTTKDGEIITIPVETDTAITRDGRKSSYSQLKATDEVVVELEYGKMKTLTATVIKRTVEGTIKKIGIGEEMYLSIENKDGILEDFVILPHTPILIGGQASEIYDLRSNNRVTINIESNEVVYVMSTTVVESGRVIGHVSDIRRDINLITLRIVENGAQREIKVSTRTHTVFIAANGNRIGIQNIGVGHEVLVVGTNSGGTFVAERVVIIK